MPVSCSFRKARENLTVAEAKPLALAAPAGLCKVALVVDPDDATLDAIVEGLPIDMLQLHGHESPDRVARSRRATACR